MDASKNLMYKFKKQTDTKQKPKVFNDIIKKPFYQYPTQFSKGSFGVIKFSLRSTKYSKYSEGQKF